MRDDEIAPDPKNDPTMAMYGVFKFAYDFFNRKLFDGALPSGILVFHRQQRVMGYASHRRWRNRAGACLDEIAINPEYFEDYPLVEICQTLCHEMVHLWQAHYGLPSRRGYHNKEWARKMIAIGLMPSSTGEPGGEQTGEQMMDYVIYDGPFIRACQELVSTGYEFPWFDSFPVIRRAIPVYAYRKDNTPIELNNDLTPKTETTLRGADQPSERIATDPAHEHDNDSYSLNASAMVQTRPIVKTTRPSPRSGRIKYSCRSCQCNVWGKPGLNIGCLDCNATLVAQE